MPSLFDQACAERIIERIAKLTPESKAHWGKMHVDQMLAHMQQPIRTALGELKLKRDMLGRIIGPLAKKRLTSGKEWPKGLPTDRQFLIIDRRKFHDEQRKLTELIRRFNTLGPTGLSKAPHPFFGKMTVKEWDQLSCQHLDHHLRQFGV